MAGTGGRREPRDLDRKVVHAIRALAMDAILAANSGHPGLPLGAASAAVALWTTHLRFDPSDPTWPDRDRFVLSAGHGSMLLYALLHLFGYDVTLDDLRAFRQWGSRTPGHPEAHLTPGVEATTGPLGQGFANAVGMALAEAHLAARFNRPGHTVVDHHTFVLASDGDLMEGIAAEAASLAGHLGLGKLIVLFDDNRISLAGTTNLAWSEDVPARHRAYGWHVLTVDDGDDIAAVASAIATARDEQSRPSLIAVRTRIGRGSPKEDSFEVHGSPLKAPEVQATKEHMGWPVEPTFFVPEDVRAHCRSVADRGPTLSRDWQTRIAAYREAHPALAREFERRLRGALPDGWDAAVPTFAPDASERATRQASQKILSALAPIVPELVGGSADLNPSTLTTLPNEGDFQRPGPRPDAVQGATKGDGPWGPAGRNVHFGIREHAMGAAVNGMALHGGFIPYGATFLVFSDYMRTPVRLSALSRLGAIWVYTHDSIGVGEDGPTHQPIEHYATLRAIPDLHFIRPADANETAWAWRVALADRSRPTALALTRQAVPILDRSRYAPAEGVTRGAYVLNPEVTRPDVILMASGSEVGLIVAAGELLRDEGHAVRLVSFPSWDLFAAQPAEYRESVLPAGVRRRLAVEAGVSLGWAQWVGDAGVTIAIDRFGASAPGDRVFTEFGFTRERIVARVRELLA